MNKFIFTFGCGQANAGKCQPIFAPNAGIAREKMFELYGSKWAFQYGEKDWEECKINAEKMGFKIETEMEPIYAVMRFRSEMMIGG